MTKQTWSPQRRIETTYQSSLNSLIDRFVELIKKRFAKKVTMDWSMRNEKFDPERHSLAQFVEIKGGLKSKQPGFEGELRRIRSCIRGASLLNPNGKMLDDMAQQANAAGFETPDINSFLDLLEIDLNRKYTHQRIWSLHKRDYIDQSVLEEEEEYYRRMEEEEEYNRRMEEEEKADKTEIKKKTKTKKPSSEELGDWFEQQALEKEITNPQEIIVQLEDFFKHPAVIEWANDVARSMITGLAVQGAKDWREAARKSMRGREIYLALQQEMAGPIGMKVRQMIIENANLISTFPNRISKEVNNFISRETYKGRRSEFIAKDLLEQFPKVAKSRMGLIARTECSKASTALTRARSEELNLPAYIWRTSEDVRVRDSHRLMDDVICFWGDPPSPETLAHEKRTYGNYGPGEIFRCRCYPEPILHLEDINWPHKVYSHGQIRSMTLNRFKQTFGGQEIKKAA